MNVTFSMLLEETAAQLGVQPLCAQSSPVGSIRAILPLRGTPEREDALFIAAQPPKRRPRFLFCTQGDALPGAAVFPGVSRTRLLCAAQAALNICLSWGDEILRMICEGRGLDPIVAYAHERFKNPFLIYDRSLKVLAYTLNDGSDDRLWRDTVQRGTVTELSADGAKELLRYIEKADRIDTPFRHEAPELSDPFFSCNIMLEGRRVGMIALMQRHHAVTEGELGFLQNLCVLLSLQMQREAFRRETSSRLYHQLIDDLLSGSILDPDTLTARLTAIRFAPAAYTRVLRFAAENAFMADAAWKHAFDCLLSLHIGGRGMLVQDAILFLLPSDTQALSTNTLTALDGFCKAHQLRCGISDACEGLLPVHTVKNQTGLALSLGRGRVTCFADVRFDNLLAQCAASESPAELLHPAVALLAAHDRAHQTEFLATLTALFDSQHNQMLAARRLKIHRTTLFYRLQRIAEIAGVCLDDPREMLFLQFTLAVHARQTHSSRPSAQSGGHA